MKKRIFTLLLALVAVAATAGAQVAINATNFPDANFRAFVAGKAIDKDANGYLSTGEISVVVSMDVAGKNIGNLRGIEHFTPLRGLDCHKNQLTVLDVSKNTGLTLLVCDDNQLTSLDVSQNTALTTLYCTSNQLTALDVSKNTKLELLACGGNKLSTLDVSKNTALTTLNCGWNQLTALDVSKNTALTELLCFGNKIKGDKMQALVNSLPKVTRGEFYAIDTKNSNEGNVITKSQVKIAKDKGWKVNDWNGGSPQEYAGSDEGIAINATNFPDANFRKIVAGKTIDKDADGYLSTGEIAAVTVMDVKKSNIANLKGIEHFTALRMLDCCKNQLTSLDVSKNTALTALECYDNQLTALDVSKNTKLTYLDCSINQIKGEKMLALVNSLPKVTKGDFGVIDTKNSKEQNVCTKSQVNIAKGKGWTVVDYHGGSEQVYAGSDDPTGIAINATNFPDANFRNWLLEQSYGKDAILTTEEIASVTEIRVNKKGIKNLKGIEHFTALERLYCYDNQMTVLNVSKNTKLESLYCGANKLSTLDVSKNTALTVLKCYDNQLTALDVSKNTKLTVLVCSNNQLTALDVSKNTALTELECYDNQLTALDVSKNTKLTYLDCSINQIKGEKMLALVNSLPKVTSGEFCVIDTKDSNEQNVITKSQVKIATDKGWKVYDYNGGRRQEYAGSDDPTGIAINATNFPDENFRNWLLKQSYGKDAILTTGEIASVTEIRVNEKGIENLKGIEHFTALQILSCNGNQLTSLDVSQNTALTTLYCTSNQLTALDVSKNTKLELLACGDNKLSTLDVSKNTALTTLNCGWNQLTALDVSKNTALEALVCFGNKIKGDKMQALVNSLPKVTSGEFYAINTKNSNEQNVITKSQVNIAKGKDWKVYDFNGGSPQEYAGSDDTTTGLTAVESGQLTVDSWYSIDGKKLAGEPTKKGVYIIKGKKVKK